MIANVVVEVAVEHLVARCDDERGAELKRTRTRLVLTMPGLTRTLACGEHCGTDQRHQDLGTAFDRCSLGGIALFVDQYGKRNSLVVDECLRVHHVARTDRDHIGTGGRDVGVIVTQLRGMLSAKHSTEMSEKDDNDRLVRPVVTEAVLLSIDASKFDVCKFRDVHARSLSRICHRGHRGVDNLARARLGHGGVRCLSNDHTGIDGFGRAKAALGALDGGAADANVRAERLTRCA